MMLICKDITVDGGVIVNYVHTFSEEIIFTRGIRQ